MTFDYGANVLFFGFGVLFVVGGLAAVLFGSLWLVDEFLTLRKKHFSKTPTPDLIDWPAVLERMDSLDCKLSALLDEKDTVPAPTKDTLCEQCDDSGWGECLQLGHCDRPKVQEDMLKPTDGHHCRWEWKLEEYQTGNWSDDDYVKSMQAKGLFLTYQDNKEQVAVSPSVAEAAVDPAALPPSQTLGDAELVQMTETFGGVLVPSYKKGGPEAMSHKWQKFAPTETLGQSDLTKYLSSLQAMRMGREAEIGDGGCCGGGSGSGSMAHPQPKVLEEDAV